MRSSEDFNRLLSQSGFPLQMAIDRLISDHSDRLGWRVLSREHGWSHTNGQVGFVDLVLEDQWRSSVLAIECKRVLDAEWLFLVDSKQRQTTRAARIWINNTHGHGVEHYGYFDANAEPASAEAMFCVVPGQDAKSRPMLERTAAEVVAGTQAIASEEQPFMTEHQHGIRMYASVVVTTARLIVSRLDAAQVALDTGTVSTAEHSVVPWIRFKKSLSSEIAITPTSQSWDYSAIARAKEKMVFVVNVAALEDFLSKWSVDGASLRTLMR
jgi:hypothetical protein